MIRKGDLLEVPLSGRAEGRVMLVDAIWGEFFETRTACLASHGYAVTRAPEGGQALVHRLVSGCRKGDGLIVDHINHDILDNRSDNLRVGSRALNNQNKIMGANRGVFWRANRWEARAGIDGVDHYLGRFTDKEEAMRVAHEFRLKNMPGYVHHPEDDQEG